jgi:hypothetical protein
MNIKLNILTAAILAGISTGAISQIVPPEVPAIYAAGPTSPLISSTDLSLAERTAYANYEAVMQIAEARIHATSCAASTGSFAVTAASDGVVLSPSTNYVTVDSPSSTFTVSSTADLPDTIDNRGQKISVDMAAGALSKKALQLYHADVAFNGVNNMMDSNSFVSILGINNRFDKYYGKVIKDFYRGSLDNNSPDFYNIYDWGLQSLDKIGYPVNKYWQRSMSHRDDGSIGRTVFVKDRLVGATACRIIIDTSGFNNQDFFQQTGALTIQVATPGVAVPQFTAYPFVQK